MEEEDILGTGAILKQVIKTGDPGDLDMEAPRRFFAFIDIETRLDGKLIESDSHTNFAISVDSDLFPAVTIVIPLMNIGEKSLFKFKPRFAYGDKGNLPEVPPDSTLECTIKLLSRYASEEYIDNHLNKMELKQRLCIADRKRERGNFWFKKEEYQYAIESYKSSLVYLEDALPAETINGQHSNETDETRIKSSLVSAKNNLAFCYIKTDQYKKALSAVEGALDISPNNIKSLYRKSTIESNTGKFEDAIVSLNKILELEPENKAAKTALEQLGKKQREQTQAEKDMCKRMFSRDEHQPMMGLNGGSKSTMGGCQANERSMNIAKYSVIGAALFAITSALVYTQLYF